MPCGFPPFNGDNNDEVHDAVRRGKCRFPSSSWLSTSKGDMNFIRKLLQKNPRKRMTVEQALQHPWITRHMNNGDAVMSDEDRQENSYVEVVFKQSSRDSIIC